MIRAPAAESDSVEESAESRNSEPEKRELQARIEFKRRDDLVRRREFNYLRKLRSQGNVKSGFFPKPSAFQNSSSFRPDEIPSHYRESTIKKIDAIEAYMAEHWKHRKRPNVNSAGSGRPTPPTLQAAPLPTPGAGFPTLRDVVSATPPAAVAVENDMDLDFTGFFDAPIEAVPESAPEPELATVVVEPVAEEHPNLQNAAVRFAEGDDVGAEAALLAVVQDPAADAIWIDRCARALLDLYRATDQAASFDVVAIEYAQRFGRSPPEWYSVPALLRTSAHPVAETGAKTNGAAWICPELIDEQAVADMSVSQLDSQTRRFDWGALQSIAPEAVAPLARQFTQWAEQPLALEFFAPDKLNTVLQIATVPEERATEPARWLLRLEALRVQGSHEDFETVAMDYCVTYEVSPPSWLEADCTCSLAHNTEPGLEPVSIVKHGGSEPGFVETRTPQALELYGTLLGDAVPQLEKLCGGVPPGEPLVIHCRRLIRVDLAAAESILHWLEQRNGGAQPVLFVEVPHLIGVFFQGAGIAEHASVEVLTK